MSEDVKLIPVKKYKTLSGFPTCARNFRTREVCPFLGSRRFGTEAVCMLGEQRDIPYIGDSYLKPDEHCLVWRE